MVEYIDLNDTEVLAEAGENAKLVVEEDGELKRIPASAVGQVKTVNGVEPDEAGNVGVGYNNLLDKPFYDDSIVIEWDGNIGDRVHVVTNGMGTWGKMTDRVLTAEDIIGASYETSYGTAGTFAEKNVDEYEGVVNTAGNCPTIVSIPSDNFDFNGMFLIPEKGTYFVNLRAADGQYYCTKFVKNKIKPLDAKFLPTTVPVIQSATVGQTVVVKAVDESGKPTEWEAVDVSAGGGAMIVRFTAESDSTVVSDTDIATVCEAMEAGRAVMGYLSLGGAKLMVGNPVEYMSPQTNTAGQIRFRFTSMPTETSMNVIDLLLTNTGVIINNFTIGSTT